MIKPPWYQKIENVLLPLEMPVRGGLVVIGVLCLWAAFGGWDAVKRTGFFVYLISP